MIEIELGKYIAQTLLLGMVTGLFLGFMMGYAMGKMK